MFANSADELQQSTERYTASVKYNPEVAKVLNASYRFNRDPALPIRQIDLSAQWPVSAVGSGI